MQINQLGIDRKLIMLKLFISSPIFSNKDLNADLNSPERNKPFYFGMSGEAKRIQTLLECLDTYFRNGFHQRKALFRDLYGVNSERSYVNANVSNI